MYVNIVTVKTHSCPKCHTVYWSNKNTLLYLDSPFRTCPVCGTKFVDKDLYKEWKCMTAKQKSFIYTGMVRIQE